MIPLFRGFWAKESDIKVILVIQGTIPIENYIKSRKNISAGITSPSKKSHSFVNFH